MNTVCLECGCVFETFPSKIKIGSGKYCSTKCKGAAQSKYQIGTSNPCWRGGKVTKTCEGCGKEFEIHKAWDKKGHAKFCSKKCVGIWRSNNLVRERGCNWRGGINPDVVYVRTSTRYKEWRESVFKRDFYTCQKCHNPKSRPLQAHHKIRFSVLFSELKLRYPLLSVKDVADNTPLLWDINNGETLCKKCHLEEHKRR